jgi:phosphate transport system permease protein
MIVLMATGNTALLDWSPFNGMRTLSANIAVEVPEAPYGGTLYRVLFLSACALFLMTFFVNTVAELVRQRLRDKYKAI